MTIILNDVPVKLPNDLMNIEELVKWKGISSQGTAVALNDKLIKQDQWSVTTLKELDRVTVISAAYGG